MFLGLFWVPSPVATSQMAAPNLLISIFPTKRAEGAYSTGFLILFFVRDHILIFLICCVCEICRLLYRSKQRGYLELDLVLGKWVEDHIHSLDENGIKSLVHVLDLVKRVHFFFIFYVSFPPHLINLV